MAGLESAVAHRGLGCTCEGGRRARGPRAVAGGGHGTPQRLLRRQHAPLRRRRRRLLRQQAVAVARGQRAVLLPTARHAPRCTSSTRNTMVSPLQPLWWCWVAKIGALHALNQLQQGTETARHGLQQALRAAWSGARTRTDWRGARCLGPVLGQSLRGSFVAHRRAWAAARRSAQRARRRTQARPWR